MVWIGRQIDFATVANQGIAVREPGIAGSNRAIAGGASGSCIRGRAGLTAGAAILHAG